ncbi:MAG: DsbA family protein [Thermoanaerobaculales bacterium]|nr:DsbA family protein [Thermoanaerobaculales bacterium]
MRSKLFNLVMFVIAVGAAGIAAAGNAEPPQDPDVLKFMSRALPWYSDSTFSINFDEKFLTPSGAYRLIQVQRKSGNQFFNRRTSVVLDEPGGTLWIGAAAQLPREILNADSEKLKTFIDEYVSELLMRNMRIRGRVDWNVETAGPSAVLRFNLFVNTGYGEYVRPGGVTIDGGLVLLGAPYPYDQDPVAYRRELFESSESIVWDYRSGSATVKIVEFSDFECPACRAKWPLIRQVLMKHGDAVDHGMVGYPLPSIHPWSFRSASAGWCVAEQQAAAFADFKELFYSMQRDMELSLVTPTALDFVVGNGLDEERLKECYLKQPSLDGVHGQKGFGWSLGVVATPTYYVNGWMISVPDPLWFGDFIDRFVAGEEP